MHSPWIPGHAGNSPSVHHLPMCRSHNPALLQNVCNNKNFLDEGNCVGPSYLITALFPSLSLDKLCLQVRDTAKAASRKTWGRHFVLFMIVTHKKDIQEPANLDKADMSQSSWYLKKTKPDIFFNWQIIFFPFHYLPAISVHLIAHMHFPSNSSLSKALYKFATLWVQMFSLELTLLLLLPYFI